MIRLWGLSRNQSFASCQKSRKWVCIDDVVASRNMLVKQSIEMLGVVRLQILLIYVKINRDHSCYRLANDRCVAKLGVRHGLAKFDGQMTH